MTAYLVVLTADAIVSAGVRVEAEDQEFAERMAIEQADTLEWEVDSLHEKPTVLGTRRFGTYEKVED